MHKDICYVIKNTWTMTVQTEAKLSHGDSAAQRKIYGLVYL